MYAFFMAFAIASILSKAIVSGLSPSSTMDLTLSRKQAFPRSMSVFTIRPEKCESGMDDRSDEQQLLRSISNARQRYPYGELLRTLRREYTEDSADTVS